MENRERECVMMHVPRYLGALSRRLQNVNCPIFSIYQRSAIRVRMCHVVYTWYNGIVAMHTWYIPILCTCVGNETTGLSRSPAAFVFLTTYLL